MKLVRSGPIICLMFDDVQLLLSSFDGSPLSIHPRSLMPKLPAVPAMERYRDALRTLAYSMPPKHRQLLLLHYRAPDHVITAAELAKVVGYANYRAVNLQYGTLGANLAARMKWTVPPGCQESYSIASFQEPTEDNPHWLWIMHPEVAAAIETLGWAKPTPAPTSSKKC